MGRNKSAKMRGLSDFFLDQLEKGILLSLLELARKDRTLCLEIRENYINIYYRGGNILKLEEKDGAKGVYMADFDRNYLDKATSRVPKDLPKELTSCVDVEQWLSAVPFLKHEMDLWFGRNPKNEREFQQLIVRENNLDKCAKSTDYFICDIEYANDNGRFDLIAVRWPSSGAERKCNTNIGFAFIEMKYSDCALAGNAGLKQHLRDMNEFLSDPKNLRSLKIEMRNVFNQMRRLKLIDNQKDIEKFSNEKPEYIFVLANHDRDSSILKRELEELPLSYPNLELKFAVSNFMGYGLYKQNVYALEDFLVRFKEQI
jgi:hypothetical protein